MGKVMSRDVSKPRGTEEFPNPLALANVLHYAVAAVTGVAGMWLGVLATGEGGLDVVRLVGAFLLVLVAMTHAGWAWRYSYFSISPENIQPLQARANEPTPDYLKVIIENGIPTLDPTSGTLANMLLKKVPGIRHAPGFIQRIGVAQWERSLFAAAILASFVVAMLLTWGKPAQPIVAWLYLLLVLTRVVRPWGIVVRLIKQQPEVLTDLATGVRRGDIALLVLLAIAPLLARIIPGEQIVARLYYVPSMLTVWVTLGLLVASVLVGWLCYLALVAQTAELEKSKADERPLDLPVGKADMRHAFARLDTFLYNFIGPGSRHGFIPKPVKPPVDPLLPQRQGSSPFYGLRFVESAPRASAGQGKVALAERFQEVLKSSRERPILLLGVAGVVMMFTFVGMFFWFLGELPALVASFEIVLAVTALASVLAAAEYAFAMAHQLWQRFDYTSEVLKIEVQGHYQVDHQILRDQLTASTGVVRTGSETTSAIHSINGAKVSVAHFAVESTSFFINGPRTITSVLPILDTLEHIRDFIGASVQEVHAGQAETLKREADLKQAYGASAQQALPPGRGMEDASAPPALAADEE